MRSAVLVPKRTDNRGLHHWSSKVLQYEKVGPGAYTDETKSAFPSRSSTSHQRMKSVGTFGTGSRDTHFSKYQALHQQLVSKGLN